MFRLTRGKFSQNKVQNPLTIFFSKEYRFGFFIKQKDLVNFG